MAGPPVKQASETIIRRSSTGSQVGGERNGFDGKGHQRHSTLSHVVLEEELAAKRKDPNQKGNFTLLMIAIAGACKAIAHGVSRAYMDNLFGSTGNEVNSSGDIVKRLDVLSNDTLVKFLCESGELCLAASEEEEDLVAPADHLTGEFVVVFDPLDGSTNIDAGVNVGTIFGIYRRISDSGPSGRNPGNVQDVLQPSRNLLAAGYAMYGASTILVLATRNGVNGFTLDVGCGEFMLTHPNMRMPERGKLYSINEGNRCNWDQPTLNFVQSLKEVSETRNPYSLRYIGTMVGDVHRTMCYGGIFMYPADKRAQGGKLRLLYECGPMGFICEMSGGRASTGKVDVKDVVPTRLHQRCSIYLGSKMDVDDAVAEYHKVPSPYQGTG
eukprot:Tamp_15328.p1 GENE.Tamp_15328~~Tamp_15328.p1  ORF type:complete len:403 (+),score=50.44 Tamp_15328:61-1209(+)